LVILALWACPLPLQIGRGNWRTSNTLAMESKVAIVAEDQLAHFVAYLA
jgi:hypothetical protein